MNTKRCGSCKEVKLVSEFSKKGKGKLQSNCKTCSRLYSQEHYKSNKHNYLERNRRRRREMRAWWKEYRGSLQCSRCSENHISCLQFHHKDPSLKEGNLSLLINNWSKAKMLSEVEKCEVLCANCHFKEHHDLRNNE